MPSLKQAKRALKEVHRLLSPLFLCVAWYLTLTDMLFYSSRVSEKTRTGKIVFVMTDSCTLYDFVTILSKFKFLFSRLSNMA